MSEKRISYVDQLTQIFNDNDGALPKLEVHRLLMAADEKRDELEGNLRNATELLLIMDEHRNVIETRLKQSIPAHIAYEHELQAIDYLSRNYKPLIIT